MISASCRRAGVERHDVGAVEQITEHDRLDALGADVLVRNERIAGDHLHPERARPPRDGAADAAEADDPQARAGDPSRIAAKTSQPRLARRDRARSRRAAVRSPWRSRARPPPRCSSRRCSSTRRRHQRAPAHVEVVEAHRVRRDRLEARQPRQLRPADGDIRRDEQADDVVSLGTLGRLDRDVRVEVFPPPTRAPRSGR